MWRKHHTVIKPTPPTTHTLELNPTSVNSPLVNQCPESHDRPTPHIKPENNLGSTQVRSTGIADVPSSTLRAEPSASRMKPTLPTQGGATTASLIEAESKHADPTEERIPPLAKSKNRKNVKIVPNPATLTPASLQVPSPSPRDGPPPPLCVLTRMPFLHTNRLNA